MLALYRVLGLLWGFFVFAHIFPQTPFSLLSRGFLLLSNPKAKLL